MLRSTKLDELPQLFNILKGDMSLVGPRPEVPRYVTLFKEDYVEILTVRPGLTDLASLNTSMNLRFLPPRRARTKSMRLSFFQRK